MRRAQHRTTYAADEIDTALDSINEDISLRQYQLKDGSTLVSSEDQLPNDEADAAERALRKALTEPTEGDSEE